MKQTRVQLMSVSILALMTILSFLFLMENTDSATQIEKIFGTKNELDECFHVYIDLGTNVGIQFRKLFEPESYPDAPMLNVFDENFGKIDGNGQRGGHIVCGVGFEPNPHHKQTLKELQSSHEQCGWRSIIFSKTAASHQYGKIDFVSDNDLGNMEWGGGILPNHLQGRGTTVDQVRQIRLADYILYRVMTRKIPKDSKGKPVVLLKMDIEGSELEVLTDLIVTGALQHIHLTFAEFHSALFNPEDERHKGINKLANTLNFLSETTKRLNMSSLVNFIIWDDETYHTSKVPLKRC